MNLDDRLRILLRKCESLRARVHELYLAVVPEATRKSLEAQLSQLERLDGER